MRRNRPIAHGVLIVAALTFLLNAACFGLLITGSRPQGVPLNPLPVKQPPHESVPINPNRLDYAEWARAFSSGVCCISFNS